MSTWLRLAHMKYQPLVKVGEYVTPQTVVGYVGRTGFAKGFHVHLDGTKAKPLSWTQYTRGLSRIQVDWTYINTTPYVINVLPYPNRYLTTTHLQWTTDGLFHPGVDLNVAPDDDGLAIHAPCYGRVQYVSDPVFLQRIIRGIRMLFRLDYNHGFGNFIWIEKDESKDPFK